MNTDDSFCFFVIFLIIVFEDRFPEDKSTSAKTGFAPQFTTEVAEATKIEVLQLLHLLF